MKMDACSLPGDELRDRVAMIRRDLLPRVTRREDLADGVAFEFEHTPAMQKKLEDFVAFERECCSGLEWNLGRPSNRVLQLRVRGLAPDSDFFRALGVTGARGREGVARLAQACGLGASVSFLLCCVVPIGVAAVTGAALAAPLAKLDDPPVIAAASVGLAVPAWFWLKRRAAGSGAPPCGDGC